jgi:hypothetical protein
MKKRFSAQELRELRNLIPINTVIKELLLVPTKISEGCFRFLLRMIKINDGKMA